MHVPIERGRLATYSSELDASVGACIASNVVLDGMLLSLSVLAGIEVAQDGP